MHFDEDIFALGLANAGPASQAKSFTLALYWYRASVIKYYLTYERTTFSGGTASRPPENAVIFRVQLAF